MSGTWRAVLFDLDGTLFDRNTAVAQLALDQAQTLRPLLGATTPARFAQRLVELDARGYVKKPLAYRQLVEELALDAAHPLLQPERLSEDFFRRYADHSIAFDGAVDTVAALRQRGLRIGVITNGRVSVQRAKLDALGLLPLLDAVLISEAEGLRKPDAALFQRALDRLGVTSREAVHVGDHPVNDVRAARAAGVRAIWMRDRYWPEPEADGVIDELPELLQLAGVPRAAPLIASCRPR